MNFIFTFLCLILYFNCGNSNDEVDNTYYFLFMLANTPILHEKVWSLFFNNTIRKKSNIGSNINYKVFIHNAKVVHANDNQPSFTPPTLFEYNLVPEANNIYCKDLVSPMNQLLLFALKSKERSEIQYHSRNSSKINYNDMFIFLSADSIPVKSMEEMENNWEKSSFQSEFCLTPFSQWLKKDASTLSPLANRESRYIIKHHQWSIFNSLDAKRIINAWKLSEQMNKLAVDIYKGDVIGEQFRLLKGYRRIDGFDEKKLCRDEFWHGLIVLGEYDIISKKFIQTFDGHLHNENKIPFIDINNPYLGTCRTYIHWGDSDFSKIMDPFYIPADIDKEMKYRDLHLIVESGIKFWSYVKESSNNFYFVRKVASNSIVKYNFTDISIFEMSKLLNLYS